MFTGNYQYILNRDSEKKFTKLITKNVERFWAEKFNEEKGMWSLFYTTSKSSQAQSNNADMGISCLSKGFSNSLQTYHPSTTIY